MSILYTLVIAYNLAQGEILSILENLGIYEPENNQLYKTDKDGADIFIESPNNTE